MARRILLADDSVTAQNMGRRILTDAGYEVTTVNNGSAALKKIAEHAPDLIILDVYMPGYGGLEVCSRLKENKETARIPVLLTVGKLEPFKPDEARRVRADAFIVKPFEASELLTALTKLEDKIVPQAEPHKSGRFAKAMATAEESADRFGDEERGWKERLSIPGPKAKKKQPEPEPPPVITTGSVSQDLGRDPDFKPSEGKFERGMPAGIPADIKPEEIAAIAAAAAAIGGKPEAESATVAEAPAVSQEDSSMSGASFAAASPAEEASETKVEAEPAPVESPAVEVAQAAAEEQKPEPAVAEQKDEVEQAIEAEVAKATTDAEVLAALASLSPSDGDFSSLASSHHNGDHASVVATAAGAESGQAGGILTGPRWMAEPVAVAEDESTFDLEHEMQKAYAAIAAADAARMAAESPAPVSETPSFDAPSSNAAEAQPEMPASVDAVAQSVVNEPTAPEPVAAAEATTAPETAQVSESAAYAAAASSGNGSGVHTSEAVPAAENTAAEVVARVAEETEPAREAELAAAWENWRQIRETIMGPPAATAEPEAQAPVEAIAEVPAEAVPVAESAPQEEAAAPSEEAEPETTSGSEDPEALASIVDGMLAELKPKLMEELSKKLSKEKKKKK